MIAVDKRKPWWDVGNKWKWIGADSDRDLLQWSFLGLLYDCMGLVSGKDFGGVDEIRI